MGATDPSSAAGFVAGMARSGKLIGGKCLDED